MSATDFFVIALATWRIASMLVNEDGPFDMFVKLRRAVGIEYDTIIPDGFLPGLLSCVWCASMWIALWLYLCWVYSPKMTIGVCSILALSAASIFFDHVLETS